MLLYIVRHGETDWNKSHRVQGRTDIPLNDYGRRLAEETAEGMKDIQIDIGMTSPLLRAKETAQIILKGRDVPLYDEARLQARPSTVSFVILAIIYLRMTQRRSRSSMREQGDFLNL